MGYVCLFFRGYQYRPYFLSLLFFNGKGLRWLTYFCKSHHFLLLYPFLEEVRSGGRSLSFLVSPTQPYSSTFLDEEGIWKGVSAASSYFLARTPSPRSCLVVVENMATNVTFFTLKMCSFFKLFWGDPVNQPFSFLILSYVHA